MCPHFRVHKNRSGQRIQCHRHRLSISKHAVTLLILVPLYKAKANITKAIGHGLY